VHNEVLNDQAMSDSDDSADDGDKQRAILAAAVETPEEDSCIVCMLALSNPPLALVPCGHHRFC